MGAIGGYFELELLNLGGFLHDDGVLLNSGRSALEYVFRAMGEDLITAMTRYIVGDSVPKIVQRTYNGHWAEVILHSDRNSIFDHIEIDKTMSAKGIEKDVWVNKGDMVSSFNGANDTIGTSILRFDSVYELERSIGDISSWLDVIVR